MKIHTLSYHCYLNEFGGWKFHKIFVWHFPLISDITFFVNQKNVEFGKVCLTRLGKHAVFISTQVRVTRLWVDRLLCSQLIKSVFSQFLSFSLKNPPPPPQLSPPAQQWPPPLHFPPTAHPLLASSPSPRRTWCRRRLSRSLPSLQSSGPHHLLHPPVPAPTASKVIYHDNSQSVSRSMRTSSPPEDSSPVNCFMLFCCYISSTMKS